MGILLFIFVKKKIELLAPGGDIDSIKAAILAGADAIYCGLDRFNARNRATNITLSDLNGIIRLAHQNNCEIFITLNILIVENEIPAIIELLNRLVNIKIDGIIIQDSGLLFIISKYFKSLKIHASTQLTTHNEGQIQFLSQLSTTRVNLSRELNIHEIKLLTAKAHQYNMLTEVFVQGSNCISFSGQCYASSVQSGNSGNRGRCSQPCRDKYNITAVEKQYPLNVKDNSAFFELDKLVDANVDSLKIEGRIKKFDYVYTVVNSWKKQISSYLNNNQLLTDNSNLYKAFNRDFTNSFLTGGLDKDMFIDNPRDHSIQHLTEINNYASDHAKELAERAFYKEKEILKKEISAQINQQSIEKLPLTLIFSGEVNSPLTVIAETPEKTFTLQSEYKLKNKGTQVLNKQEIEKRFKAVNDTQFYIHDLLIKDIKGTLYLPFKELTALKHQLLFYLNDSKDLTPSVKLPGLKNAVPEIVMPKLSILISSEDDIAIDTNADIYFQLPSGIKKEFKSLVNLFTKNTNLIPWFPSIIIGEDYLAGLDFLDIIKPEIIVSNNTGIANHAYKKNINWIAGPQLNVVNSYSLQCLKMNFNCTGSFISNELGKTQIKSIKRPENFELHYSIFHPIVLMTSRACLFHQITGCNKYKIDNTCIQHCEKHSTITNSKNEQLFIHKFKGHYHQIYNHNHYLNIEIINDFKNHFDGYTIDLRDIKTQTTFNMSKSELITLFEEVLKDNENAGTKLKHNIHPTTMKQYTKGI